MDNKQLNKILLGVKITAVTGAVADQTFKNGFILAYLSRLDIPSGNIMFLLALPSLVLFLMTVPFAYISDWFGKKLIGFLGIFISIIGFTLLALAPFFSKPLIFTIVILGISIFSVGLAFLFSVWFALLSPIVPANLRGRFFGGLRLALRLTAVIFTFIVTYLLHTYSSIKTYQIILAVCTVGIIIRILLFNIIPELEKSVPDRSGFLGAIANVVRIPGYMPFCSYVFLLMLATGSIPWLFGLLEKDVLLFSEGKIVLMGNLIFIGMVIGFYFGGKMIDRIGTKSVFLCCHFGYGIVLLLFVMRGVLPIPVTFTVGILSCFFGSVQAASSIAITSEMMALISQENKTMSTSFCTSLILGGAAISGILSGQIIKLNILNKQWSIFGMTMSNYDTMILGCSIMVVLLVVTLGLIPSVIKKAQWMPHVT